MSAATISPARTIKPRGLPHSCAACRNATRAGRGIPVQIGRFHDAAAYAAARDAIGADWLPRSIFDLSFIGTASREDDGPEGFWSRVRRFLRRQK